MERQGLAAQDVSRRTGIPLKSIYGYLKGAVDNPRGEILRKFASALGVSEQELRFGASSLKAEELRKVPVLDMNKLGTLGKHTDPLSVWDGVSVASVSGSVPDDAFAVTLVDESASPEFQQGDMIVCSKSAEVMPGRFVLAVVTRLRAAVFRRYRPNEMGQTTSFKLLAPNPDYPDISIASEDEGYVVARVLLHIRHI